ncbi:hypothetical protein CBS147317_4709 [Penicillium roqueforti]|uniref:uncharacterized protein n=1 Tax=Penicillium roqueforti TaxID=5082 RepID=UPI00190D9F31|nr:uncharacterized protein LCP9604111_3714 [Penicillium roqueforti]KAF9250198.1 hypothetical protein LCP9604111_3714 [Penicillium roqueforti]KAI2717154.1 hypothetical protein CBS147318_5281 [Penicillium roqueforti]KAI2727277.1 hypothetical protein CBS147354_3479 [Penicillium roqueforti]KAI3135360.1 hypothetical protein CBS147330_3412 [Penicillium roqueforti]KAI3158621.1 hypothetical protein CBS147317_4709 [Penicillium roqueforti]
MSRLGDFDYLHGTKVTLEHSSPSPSATFVLDDKLSEEFQTMTQEEHDDDLGHPFAALNFSCHNLLDPTQQSFIRFYYQIPIDGTIYHSPQARAQQALTQHTHADVKALISPLLGHGDRVQGVRDYVPGGYINYVVWTRVAGESINSVPYWNVISNTGRRELQKDVWASSICCLRKLIYDEATTKSISYTIIRCDIRNLEIGEASSQGGLDA